MSFDDFYDYLLNLCDKLSHRVDEQDDTIEYYQKEIKRLHQVFNIKDSARVELVKENKDLKNKIDLLNNQIDNLQRNVGYLCEENTMLRHALNEVKNNDKRRSY